MDRLDSPEPAIEELAASEPAWSRLFLRGRSRKRPSAQPDTVLEIAQQPWVWWQSVLSLEDRFGLVTGLASDADQIVFTGAGSSYYAGRSVERMVRVASGKPVYSVPTTDLVVDVQGSLPSNGSGLLVSFSRSGASEESFEAIRVVRKHNPSFQQLLITCNPEGKLIQEFHQDRDFSALALHPATCDKSLAMTSSFSSLVVAAQMLAFRHSWDDYLHHVRRLIKAGESVLRQSAPRLEEVAQLGPERICLLGPPGLIGAALEGTLKVLEMTDGRIPVLAETFLGVRHGPLSFVNPQTLVICMVSSDPRVRRYELDLLNELKQKQLGQSVFAVGQDLDSEVLAAVDRHVELSIDGIHLPDDSRVPLDIMVAQILALTLSLNHGLDPDHPSPRGVISRVAQGVRIYE
jgi:tagatose-6-phosphate ketose/aldose isomerase